MNAEAPPALISPETPLADVTMTVQAELTRLAAVANDIQETFGAALIQAARSQPETLGKAQGLDLLAQHLCGVADFLEALAPHMPADWSVDPVPAARTVRLSDLSARLAGHPPAAAAVEDFEFFFD